MSKLDQLIAKLCQDGVVYKTLGEIGTVISAGSAKASGTEFA
jgi:hypothetical protein